MKSAYITAVLIALAVACGEEDPPREQTDAQTDSDGCRSSGLAGLCGVMCPKDRDVAIQQLCSGGGMAFATYENDCGGTSVTTPDTEAFARMVDVIYLAGRRYDFDERGKLIGGTEWSDAVDLDCPGRPFYGKECHKLGKGELHRCD